MDTAITLIVKPIVTLFVIGMIAYAVYEYRRRKAEHNDFAQAMRHIIPHLSSKIYLEVEGFKFVEVVSYFHHDVARIQAHEHSTEFDVRIEYENEPDSYVCETFPDYVSAWWGMMDELIRLGWY